MGLASHTAQIDMDSTIMGRISDLGIQYEGKARARAGTENSGIHKSKSLSYIYA